MKKLFLIVLFLLFSATCFGWSNNDYTDEEKAIVADALTKAIYDIDGNGVVDSVDTGGSMTYPGAGIAVSTGSAWDTSITDNSTNWNTAYGWGNHADAGYVETSDTSAWDKNASDDFDGSYTSLSDIPLSFIPATHGNEAHTDAYITAGDIPAETDPDFAAWLLATPPIYVETDPSFAAWLLATPPLYAEVDGSTSNEIQTIDVAALDGTTLKLSLSSDGEDTKEIPLAGLQDGTGTDDQTAAEVSVSTTDFGGIFSNTTEYYTLQDIADAVDDHNHSGVYQPADADLDDLADGSLTGSKVSAASDSAAGVIELATAGETTTGTATDRAVTPDGLAGSYFGKRTVTIKLQDDATAPTVVDGIIIFTVPATLSGMNLVAVSASVTTVSSSGLPEWDLYNLTDSTDMLSTDLTIDATEYNSKDATTAAVIDATHDDVVTGDRIRIDCDSAGTGTKGAQIDLVFQTP